ncbi:hypothetical protein OK074_1851 [Actinobacteria bacterium OK074]|nr:hypothetical protein OK074_1851 [Actinobacteria bacterium OK074]
MKRRSVQNDPISTPERDRGAVVSAFTIDITKAAPVKPATALVKPATKK